MRYKRYTRNSFRKELKHYKDIHSLLVKQHNKLMQAEGFFRFLDLFETKCLKRFSDELIDQQERLKEFNLILIDPLDESRIEDDIRINIYISISSLIRLYTDIFDCIRHIVTGMMKEQLKKL